MNYHPYPKKKYSCIHVKHVHHHHYKGYSKYPIAVPIMSLIIVPQL